MILKLKRGTNWLYIDNIIDLTVENAKPEIETHEESEHVSTFIYSRWHKTGVVAQEAIDCNETSYLLNDNGKTIEKLI